MYVLSHLSPCSPQFLSLFFTFTHTHSSFSLLQHLKTTLHYSKQGLDLLELTDSPSHYKANITINNAVVVPIVAAAVVPIIAAVVAAVLAAAVIVSTNSSSSSSTNSSLLLVPTVVA